MKFGIAAGQPGGVALRQRIAGQRREEGEFGAEPFQAFEIGGVEEGERGVAGDRDAAAGEASAAMSGSGRR